MHVISKRALREFWEVHPLAKESLAAWHRLMERGDYADFNAVRRTFAAADYVAPCTVFDVGGNKYRIVAVIHYNRKRVHVRHVFTHSDYDDWSDRQRGKRMGKR